MDDNNGRSTPLFGSKCVSIGAKTEGKKYSSWCYTDTKTYSWGAEVIPCSGTSSYVSYLLASNVLKSLNQRELKIS